MPISVSSRGLARIDAEALSFSWRAVAPAATFSPAPASNNRRSRLARGTNIVAEVQSPKTRSRRCCETMIFVLSSFIRLSEPTTRLRVSCPTSRTSEHSSARGCDVRMFGCLPLDGLRHLPSARSIASGLDISHRGSRDSHASQLKGNAQHSPLTAATKLVLITHFRFRFNKFHGNP